MKWIRQFLILLAITLLGEMLHLLIPLAVPAGIYGLVLLFVCLCLRIVKLEQIEGVADFLIEIMPIFFIPAGVGLMTRWTQLQSLILPVMIVIFGITVLVMIATGLVTQFMIRQRRKGEIENA